MTILIIVILRIIPTSVFFLDLTSSPQGLCYWGQNDKIDSNPVSQKLKETNHFASAYPLLYTNQSPHNLSSK